MQRYHIVVNGRTYTVTVKSLVGNTAFVDVDGWEFQVAIAEGGTPADFAPLVAAASSSVARERSRPSEVPAPASRPTAPPPPKIEGRRRSSALEELAPRRASLPEISGKRVVAASLPGLILEILVRVGDEVKANDVVCKMEAMKMVNEIRAGTDGLVKEILVAEQQNVLENQPLMIID
jgi:biotin carboxyl carrier protein